MITKEEIEHIAKLMRIEIKDPVIFDRIDKIIGYFNILDSADIESEEIMMQEIEISSLREDKHIPFQTKLIEKIYNYKGTYVRAPKMI